MEHSYGQGPGIARRRWISLYRKAASRLERSKRVTLYRDRFEAGRILATQLRAYANRKDVLVLALPRGGVPIATEVAKALHAPLDVFVVRKLGVPGHEELAMGALAAGGIRVLNADVVQTLHIPEPVINAVTEQHRHELQHRQRPYR